MIARNLSTNRASRSALALLLAAITAVLAPGCKQQVTTPPNNPGNQGQANPPNPPNPPAPPSVVVPPVPPAVVPAHSVDAEKELIIRDLRVVESARAKQVGGPWHISTLFSNMTPAGMKVSTFVLKWLRTWEAPQTVENGRIISPRPQMKAKVTDPWIGSQPGKPDEQIELDWNRAPFRLLAIVCRTDLAKLKPTGADSAGEGRFVFGVLDPAGGLTQFTVIFEYSLQASNMAQVRDWAKAWHNLGTLGDFGEPYLSELERVTTAYAGKGIAPAKGNGNALNQLRTDEIALTGPWELREFVLPQAGGLLTPVAVKVTPDISFNGTQKLADFMTANQAAILATNHDIPLEFQGPFRAASSINEKPEWSAPGFTTGRARFLVALATCSGCHGKETALAPFKFTHVDPRNAGEVAGISAFLTDAGATIPDPDDPTKTVQLSDLSARKEILSKLAGLNVVAAGSVADIVRLLQSRRTRVH
jgi:hypothetical protein